jgi:hypothetical protein
VTRRRGRGREAEFQSYCNGCHAEDKRNRRAGMIEVLLTPEEWAAIKLVRERLPF